MSCDLDYTFRRVCGWLSALALIVAAPAWAHGPFDHSARLLVSETRLELIVTLGSDATRDFLSGAGLSSSEVRQILSLTRAQSAYPLSVAVAARLFDGSADGKPLVAEQISASTDGLETLFTVVFPRPDGGTLDLRAVYFNGIEPMKQGSFVALDENQQMLGSALLSRTRDSVQITLPKKPAVAPAREPGVGTEGPSVGSVASQNVTPPAPAPQPSFGEFLKLGVEHILLGFDHLLFLGVLLLGVRKLGPMLAIITCFTLAHSVTLALSALELVTVSSRIVEPLIALSIMVVAVENLVRQEATVDRYWLAGGFGLIHGFGFASVLRESGFGQAGTSIALPLFSFNLGVELGQLAVAAAVVPLLLALRRRPVFVQYGTPAVSTLVITISGYWFLQRTIF